MVLGFNGGVGLFFLVGVGEEVVGLMFCVGVWVDMMVFLVINIERFGVLKLLDGVRILVFLVLWLFMVDMMKVGMVYVVSFGWYFV